MPTNSTIIKKCLESIEKELGWGDSKKWKSSDFELLSEKILNKTGVNLSQSTLKRLWGKVKYDSEPQPSTLNALANFLGFKNFREFEKSQLAIEKEAIPNPAIKLKKTPRRKIFLKSVFWLLGAGSLIFILRISFFSTKTLIEESPSLSKLNSELFSFSVRSVSDEVPNTVIFDFNVSEANSDSLFIQQSWDETKRIPIKKSQSQATCIYYLPGFYNAKLVVDGQIAQEQDLLISSKGWLPLVVKEPVPVYFTKEEALSNGSFGLKESNLFKKNIQLQPDLPIVGYYLVQNFPGLDPDNFSLETSFKNTFSTGSGACQFSQVMIMNENSAISIPFSIPGCSSELNAFIAGRMVNGKENDLSKLGVDFSNWVNLKIQISGKTIQIFSNNLLAIESEIQEEIGRVIGIAFHFEGLGEIDFVKISNQNGNSILEENF